MVSDTAPVLQIPTEWTDAAPYLANLQKRVPLSTTEWLELGHWLVFTKFDDQSCLAGEVAATLIRDFAPAKIRELVSLDLLLAASNERLLKAIGIVPVKDKSIEDAVIELRKNLALRSVVQALQSHVT